jgi:hypothetical protein
MAAVRRFWRLGRTAVLATVGWLAFCGVAVAQPKPAPVGPSINSSVYVMAYGLVIFGVGLGMLLVCRPSSRRERVRPEQYDESRAIKGKGEE